MKSKDTKIFIANLIKEYRFFNETFFDNELPERIDFGIVRIRHRADGITHESPLKISLSWNMVPGSQLFKETVLHEMVHIDQIINNIEIGHGDFFQQCAVIYLEAGYNINS